MTTIQLYRKHKAGEISKEKFLYEVRRDNNLPFITNLTSYEDAVKILKNKGIVTEGQTKEAKADEAVKAEVKAKTPSTKKPESLHIDQANPYEYRHGLQHELNELGEYTDEALEKAKDKVLKNLAKDTNFYSNLLNAKVSPFEFKKSETDAPGMQANADGTLKKGAGKVEKANVKDNLGKKEEGKKKPKGVKTMPDKGVTGSEKTIKEGLKGKFDSDDNIYTYDHLIKTDSPNKEELSKVLDAIKKDKEELEKKGKKVKQVKGDTVPYLELIKESVEEAKGKTYTIFDKARGEEVETYDTYEDAKAALDKINAEDPYHGDYVIDIDENVEEALPGMASGMHGSKDFQKAMGIEDDSPYKDSAEDEFNSLLSKYDWYYEMSDDPRTYDRGLELDKKLAVLGKQIGVDKAVELFNAKAPSDRKITSTFFMEGISDHPSMGSITDNPQTNIKGKMGDYDPKARAASLAKLKNFGPKPKQDDKHSKIKEALKKALKKEAGERTAFITPQRGAKQTIQYRNRSELDALRDNPDIRGIVTGDDQKVKGS